jgi:hypothetical protein
MTRFSFGVGRAAIARMTEFAIALYIGILRSNELLTLAYQPGLLSFHD